MKKDVPTFAVESDATKGIGRHSHAEHGLVKGGQATDIQREDHQRVHVETVANREL